MKRLFLVFLLIPAYLFAQENPKYMAGAVPEADGKVVFSKALNLPGQTQEQIYQTLKGWADQYFIPKDQMQNRVIFSNPEEGQIVAQGQEYLVFTDKAFSLDRTLATYQLFMECTPGKCNLKVTAIRYLYNTGGSKPEIIRAEEQITDKYTLNKAGTKLIKATGKFRIHTIDMVERLFNAASAAAGINPALTANTLSATVAPSVPLAPAPASTVASLPAISSPSSASLEGYKQIDPQKIPGNIIKMLADDWMLITAGNGNPFNMMTASWGGLGHLYNKPVAFCFIYPTRHTYQLMEKNDTYTLSFYTETYREALKYCGSHSGKDLDKVKESGLTPVTTSSGAKAFSEAWMIIECKKMVSQTFTPEALSDEKLKEDWAGKQLHKMYIGEILHVWVK